MPLDEGDEDIVTNQLSHRNTPGELVPSNAGGGSAVRNSPSSAPASVIGPALLNATRPNNSGLTQTQYPMPPGELMPSNAQAGGGSAVRNTPSSAPASVIDPALLNATRPNNSGLSQTQYPMPPGEPMPSNAGSSNDVRNTPSSSHTPVIDPALLNISQGTYPNNSGLTQHPMPAPPIPCRSGPAREPSPLSSPPDEETLTEVPSSCTKKRKSTKNNTAKGKAPPKQRRKTVGAVEGQPRTDRV